MIWIALTMASADGSQECKDSAGNSPCQAPISPCVCVERGDVTLVEGTHFTFDFTDSSNPDVTFKSGSSTAWRVWSQVSASDATPANLGDLFIDSTGTTDNYIVEIRNPNNGNAGAVNLGSAILKDTTSWTGYSSIAFGSHITGDLTSDLEVVPGRVAYVFRCGEAILKSTNQAINLPYYFA